ncbi:MAG: 50S ribosomal protein L22 [Dehalococcoidia bacterium]|nr:50S ribosomal protein L22 [Dehalococcoidia bacterium]MSQ15953.1 50S ribosomal protein L22 [Dehalococcoidia bacterium]
MPPVRASAKQIGASTKRLRPMMDLVRGKGVDDALNTLLLLPSPWARSIAKVVQAAASNAENNMLMDRRNLRIVHITADVAVSIKRMDPRARGRIGHITKRSSHITVIVDAAEGA